ncbi:MULTISPECIES: hypothetical protein [unclassified Bacillus (in: firmicutes)]|uniref:hypothetical protein n=1 Tax=Bacillaceae TaxID=186817 RepID=UPI000BF24843|nr:MULTISPECIES: hypothetical protein [unclassified Bacillus (in: firmicutes)]PEJ60568.1 hypothetical protein CN692_00305 [Bacillus sp. AFS002410]PEL09922.1 hypothetical protein CN601_15400 [Bacillus sp. AFS017336]QKE73710.1 hypothetical protein HPK19_13235 [Arthrobacter citreus]
MTKLEFDFQNLHISKHTDYKGYKIRFSINHQNYVLLVGKTKILFPLNLIHVFSERETCQLCGKLVFPSNISQQVCPTLFNRRKELLAYFQEKYSEQF